MKFFFLVLDNLHISPLILSVHRFISLLRARVRKKKEKKRLDGGRPEKKKAVHSISATKKNTGKKMAEIETFLSDSF